MAFNAGDIFSTYLQGANFVANSLDRAEARRRQAEEDELQKVAGRGAEIFAPKYDKDGKLIPRTSGDIFNDPQTLELANHPYMKSARMQGITDPNVKDVRYVGGTPLEDGQHVVPIVEQLDEDGNVIARGPLTEGRSRDGKSKVVPITVDTMFNHLAGEVYRRNPTLGKELLAISHEQALRGLQTQYRNTASPEEREQLVQIAGSYGYAPESLMRDSGTPVTKTDLKTGFIQRTDPAGSVTFERPTQETTGLSDAYNASERSNATQDQRAKLDTQLRFEKDTQPEQLSLRAGELTNAETVKRSLSAEEGKIFDAGVSMALSGDPATQAKGRETLAQIMPPEKIDPLLNGQMAKSSLSQGILTNFRDMNEEQVRDQVAANFSNLSKDDQLQYIQGLANGLKRGDPKAKAAFETAMMPKSVEGGNTSAAPKPAEFNPTGVDKWTSDAPEEQKRKTRLQGEQMFRDALTQYPAAKDSQAETDLNMAVGEALREGLPNHVLPLVNWTKLQKDPTYAGGIKSSREFIEEVHTPIVDLAKKNGLSTAPQTLAPIERMAVGLMARGIANSDAVTKALEVEKNPALVDKIIRLFPKGAAPAEREKLFLDTLAADLKTARARDLRSTLREGADYTFGGGTWR